MHYTLEFTEADLPHRVSQPERVAEKVRELFDGTNPVKIADVARALGMNYGTCKTHIHRAGYMGLLKNLARKGFIPNESEMQRKLIWRKTRRTKK